ncbi:hypothetical protein XA68_10778 [Ophiocordyceps unilateralis]|uniref:B30.2/SPRY domain-containing protein n=1 Tax=Ophiocordyceps unilateralis TaxID=268505 RepID=A0A2A9NY84_OPHUN|nr:hypothetical protein XA68_10778 [Ophiocordyceps unilateralis]
MEVADVPTGLHRILLRLVSSRLCTLRDVDKVTAFRLCTTTFPRAVTDSRFILRVIISARPAEGEREHPSPPSGVARVDSPRRRLDPRFRPICSSHRRNARYDSDSTDSRSLRLGFKKSSLRELPASSGLGTPSKSRQHQLLQLLASALVLPDPTGEAPQGRRLSSATPPFYSHPARVSALSADGRLLVDPPPGFAGTLRADGVVMDASPNDDLLHVWSASGSLPSFSRAFDMFTQPLDSDGAPSSAQGQFFVPSYLRGTPYIKMLQEANKAKLQAQRDSRQPSGVAAASNATAFSQPLPTPGAHRGLAHSIVERTPASCEDDQDPAVAPLPSRWNKEDAWPGIDFQPDDLSIKYTGPKNSHERDHEASAARADHYMPPQCGLYYFEVQILHGKRDDTTIAIGFSTKATSLSRPVGWEPDSWGYHGDDGRCFSGQNIGRSYGPTFNAGDVVGCGVNFRDNSAFFTKNGVKLNNAFHEVVRGKLYPSVSLKKPGEHVLVNFGQVPFVYNIDDMMRLHKGKDLADARVKGERRKMQQEISDTNTSKLEPGMSETDLIQTLVLQFLQHDGYVETARAFAEDMRAQRQALSLDPNAEAAYVAETTTDE